MNMKYDKYERYIKDLPVIPEVATKIMGIAEDKLSISFKELEHIIKIDPSLTAKILKVANSALYARQREITSLQMAITLLGFKNIKSLVMLVTASNTFQNHKNTPFFQMFWKHSIISAFLSKHIALRSNQKEIAEESFLCGLIHNIGQAALFIANNDKYQELIETLKSGEHKLEDLEDEYFGINHRELGALILKKWYFPELYIDIAREHRNWNIISPHKNIIIIVSIAEIFSDMLVFDYEIPGDSDLLPRLLPHSGLKDEDVEYYKNNYLNDLKQDLLFQECKGLFSLK